MFIPKTDRLKQLAKNNFTRISELEKLFKDKTNIYIDYANVRPWAAKLGWNIDVKRLKQFLDSFDNIYSVNLYNGILLRDKKSKALIDEIKDCQYKLVTKPVKILKKSIDVSSIPLNSPDILKDFIRPPLLKKLKVETIEYLNKEISELNRQGIFYLEDRKCNFDVEISRNILNDFEKNDISTFVLWSGDSDFADPIEELLKKKRKVVIFATARRVASELNELRAKGLIIYDIQKIRNFICWKKEIK